MSNKDVNKIIMEAINKLTRDDESYLLLTFRGKNAMKIYLHAKVPKDDNDYLIIRGLNDLYPEFNTTTILDVNAFKNYIISYEPIEITLSSVYFYSNKGYFSSTDKLL